MRSRVISPTLLTALCFLSASLVPVMAFTQQSGLEATKEAYNAVADRAISASERKAKLEEHLQAVQTKVAKAKVDLASATSRRLDVRRKIAEQKRYVEVLQSQLETIRAERTRYNGIINEQRTELVSFVRYVANRDMEIADTGPVVGGSVLRHMLRGSLGDIIEQDLGRQALLLAREQFFHELSAFMKENKDAEERLLVVQGDIERELATLSSTYTTLETATEHAAETINASWKKQVLTRQELENVKVETAQVNEQFLALQENLVSIDRTLREKRVSELTEQLSPLIAKRDALLARKAQIASTLTTLRTAHDDELRAFNAAMQARNTDKNTYKHIQETEAVIAFKSSEHDELALAYPPLAESTPRDVAARIMGMALEIERLSAVLAFLKQGVPLPEAEDYVRLKNVWSDAERRIEVLTSDQKAVDADIADLSLTISDLTYAIDQVKNEKLNLRAVPSTTFIWPVVGPITAYFFDPSYAAVFGVAHRAIDIGVIQGTAVKAAASGVVYHVKHGGATGYTYVLIGHLKRYATLYGHLSSVSVKAGDVVAQGQIIGRSGGKPGTDGAGPMTTGPHLHFEMMHGKEHVDPRTLLP